MTSTPSPSSPTTESALKKAHEILNFNPLHGDWDDEWCEKAERVARALVKALSPPVSSPVGEKNMGVASPSQCTAAVFMAHDSDCAMHNAPAMEAGPCDCSVRDRMAWKICPHLKRWRGETPATCQECPATERDPDYGDTVRFCMASALEIAKDLQPMPLAGKTAAQQSEGEATFKSPTGAWRDIASAPKDGRWLHLFGDGPMFASCNFIGYFGKRRTEDHLPPNWWLCLGQQGDFSYCTPTHWQPLPPSPRVQDEGEKGGDAKRSSRSALSAELQDVLADIEQFLQDRHDIRDGVLGGPHPLPNQAMVLSSALKRALGEEP